MVGYFSNSKYGIFLKKIYVQMVLEYYTGLNKHTQISQLPFLPGHVLAVPLASLLDLHKLFR